MSDELPLADAELTREQIIAAATKIHDDGGCQCDRKYLMSCPRMASAVQATVKAKA